MPKKSLILFASLIVLVCVILFLGFAIGGQAFFFGVILLFGVVGDIFISSPKVDSCKLLDPQIVAAAHELPQVRASVTMTMPEEVRPQDITVEIGFGLPENDPKRLFDWSPIEFVKQSENVFEFEGPVSGYQPLSGEYKTVMRVRYPHSNRPWRYCGEGQLEVRESL